MRDRRAVVFLVLVVLGLTAAVELGMGRLPFGPDGRFAWWEGNIWSQEQSQRFADPYSFTHVVHGLLYYAMAWLVARNASARLRFIGALAIEAAWEILENSPIIIDRYRAVTIALGYTGDSVLNSLSDVLMMSIGYLLASRLRVWQSVVLVVASELGLALWVRDNLALNLIMLIHPIDAIRVWQMAGQPH